MLCMPGGLGHQGIFEEMAPPLTVDTEVAKLVFLGRLLPLIVTLGELKQVSRAAFALLASSLDFGLAPNATATDEEFGELLVQAAFRNEFVNTVAKQRLLAQPDGTKSELPHHEPRAKALLNHLRGLRYLLLRAGMNPPSHSAITTGDNDRCIPH